MSRDQWVNQIPTLLNRDAQYKQFAVIGHEGISNLKLLEKGLKYEENFDHTIVFYEEKEPIQLIEEHMEKALSNQSCYFVLIDWKNPQNMSRIYTLLKNNSNYRVVFFFSSFKTFATSQDFVKENNLYQIALYDKSQSICYQVLKILSKFSPKI